MFTTHTVVLSSITVTSEAGKERREESNCSIRSRSRQSIDRRQRTKYSMAGIVKSVFVCNRTNSAGIFEFSIDSDFAEIQTGDWGVKLSSCYIRLAELLPSTIVSCSVNFGTSLQGQCAETSQLKMLYSYSNAYLPLKLAVSLLTTGVKGEFKELSCTGGSDFISFRYPKTNLYMTIRNESTGFGLPNTPVWAHLLITRL